MFLNQHLKSGYLVIKAMYCFLLKVLIQVKVLKDLKKKRFFTRLSFYLKHRNSQLYCHIICILISIFCPVVPFAVYYSHTLCFDHKGAVSPNNKHSPIRFTPSLASYNLDLTSLSIVSSNHHSTTYAYKKMKEHQQ